MPILGVLGGSKTAKSASSRQKFNRSCDCVDCGGTTRTTARQIDAFGTPTIVHFCAVLLVSATLSAPWHALSSVSLALGGFGLAGVVYGVIVIRRAKQQTEYSPVWEDWLWHTVLPQSAYTMLLVAAVALRSYPERVLFLVGAVALLLLFVGIHNAWDTVTYIAVGTQTKKRAAPKETAESE